MPDLKPRSPWWFAVLLVIVGAPALFLEAPAAKALASSGWIAADITGWLYPAYVIISAVSAWFCYPARRTLAWVLFFLILLTDLFLLLAMTL